MRAVVFEEFGRLPDVREVPGPALSAAGVVVRVEATGLCRSDWHGWMGHDDGIALPHVPGHELSGRIEAVGSAVANWQVGDRVTVPFVCACGRCAACAAGDHQVCERQEQPGFTHWGSFAEYVAVHQADINLVAIPETMSYITAAALGCRFATAYRAVVAQGRTRAGEWVAVHGCGGVGLSAVMIAAACGARVVAVDVAPGALELARSFGAEVCVAASATSGATAAAVREATGGGAHVSLDALGSEATCRASVESLRRRGRHVQVGLMPSSGTTVPMDRVVALELEILGSHGMAAHAYPELMGQVSTGALRPDLLVTSVIGLAEAPAALAAMSEGSATGITVITPHRADG
ncbi:alcohol dehydrogenase catalytic domain-containing protein [Streptomyces sp. AK02-01A]|uniref:alcohol dehydrogenase catalytic domain-containing protein n=1 Tax=Streptomyces sp. AK02-01A TaxID=3028648 RepID=UPI0029BE2BB0|nr:alcohol dehydrogenase catalytic domain-containing protein [Streptomyces sp. AK02-01A]MDX3852335.1 alcohol dehydrogenase catalytic domain-containing protein [Streptomyces sp. AK02-01A]